MTLTQKNSMKNIVATMGSVVWVDNYTVPDSLSVQYVGHSMSTLTSNLLTLSMAAQFMLTSSILFCIFLDF